MNRGTLLLLSLISSATAADNSNSSICHGVEGWEVTFEDEFLGNTLNASSWIVRHNMTHGPAERQLYVADAVSVSGTGQLNILTRKQSARGPRGRQYNFTSGWLDSQGLRFQKQGRFEIRAKLPSPAAGRAGKWPTAWPAHWLMPASSVCWPVGGEIDIMEGFRPARAPSSATTFTADLAYDVLFTYHWADTCGHDLFTGGTQGRFPPRNDTVDVIDWVGTWHTFSVDWAETRIDWYVDGVRRYTVQRGVPASLFLPPSAMFMILNTALEPWADAKADSGLPLVHTIDRVTWCRRRDND